MFQELLNLMPHQLGTIALIISAVGSLAGLVLWLTGARFSRSMLTLGAVGLGTVIGLRLPGWCKWQIDPMGPAVGGALILGVSAFALHRLWVGAGIGVLLTGWSGLAIWTLKVHDQTFAWPEITGRALPDYLSAVWQSMPAPMQHYLPAVAAASMAAGLLAALAWPRAGTMLLWSLAGVTLVVTLGCRAMAQVHPASMRHLPRDLPAQCLVLAALVAVGAILQYQWTPIAKNSGGGDSGRKSEGKKETKKDSK